ncbi:MAG: peptidoglycan bridge formation glycyltransferase FemA/FemB family protein [Chloroflexi bacterium]|nr:peptidoglycan bridge formation glycyltransferase FemA/FemB family protein [Chloroflexota bacterium]
MLSPVARTSVRSQTTASETWLVEDADEWDARVIDGTLGNILQSYEWGEFKARFGWTPRRLLVERAGRALGVAQVLLRATPLGTIAYVPRGPIIQATDREGAAAVLDAIHCLARSEEATFLRIEPEIRNGVDTQQFFRAHGFRPGDEIQPRSTLIVDLRPDLANLARRLNPKTRYNVGLAQRRGVTIVEGGPDDLPAFYQLLEETSQRGSFLIHSLDYYEEVWNCLEARGMAQLFLATYAGEVLAGTMILIMGKCAYYMYGASNGKYRNLKPNDLLQWESIKWAKSEGSISYDLWGIPDAVGQQAEQGKDPEAGGDDLWGVYQFKRGFGGEIVRYVGAHDYAYSHARYWLWQRLLPKLRAMGAALRRRSGRGKGQ